MLDGFELSFMESGFYEVRIIRNYLLFEDTIIGVITMHIPKDTILLLSGVSCVGKTTAAYGIVKKYPEFRRVSELDLVRTIVRVAYGHLSETFDVDKNTLMQQYKALFASITNSDFKTTKLQSEQLLPYLEEIVHRQQRRQIPTIIEGAGIVPSTFFPDNQPLDWIMKNVIIVNLYLSSEEEHICRRKSRIEERDYIEDLVTSEKIVFESRRNKNDLLHIQTTELRKQFRNVFSIDVSNSNPEKTVDEIMKCVSSYFNNN